MSIEQGTTVDPRASCQANRSGAAPLCRRCGRKIGEGCGERGHYADSAIADALEAAMQDRTMTAAEARVRHAREIAEIEREVNSRGGDATIPEIIAIMAARGWRAPE
jgi:hypothetical protein